MASTCNCDKVEEIKYFLDKAREVLASVKCPREEHRESDSEARKTSTPKETVWFKTPSAPKRPKLCGPRSLINENVGESILDKWEVSPISSESELDIIPLYGEVRFDVTWRFIMTDKKTMISLESFHIHINRFIPGTLAKDINFQVFVLYGLFRWNTDRQSSALVDSQQQNPMTYSGPLKNAVNRLSQEVWGKDMFRGYELPGKYTGVRDYTNTTRLLLEGPDTEEMEIAGDPAANEEFPKLDDMTDPTFKYILDMFLILQG